MATLFEARYGSTSASISISPTWNGLLGDGLDVVQALCVYGKQFLLAYDKASGIANLFLLAADPLSLLKQASLLNLGRDWDALRTFTLGNRPFLMAYQRKGGTFAFFEILADLTVSKPFRWGHPRDPGLSVGFSEVEALVSVGLIYFFGYNFDTGNVVLYSLSMTSKSAGAGEPPLAGHHLWQRSWAAGWTRFAFFQLGGRNFFLKTNVQKPNVNIDQVLDDPADGTAEVATHMTLEDAQNLDICAAFTIDYSDPCFAAYKKTGETAFYRIHADCQGWSKLAQLSTITNAKAVVPLSLGAKSLLLFV